MKQAYIRSVMHAWHKLKNPSTNQLQITYQKPERMPLPWRFVPDKQ